MAFTSETACSYLERAAKDGRLAHAYLITGASQAEQEALATKLLTIATGEDYDDLIDAEGKAVTVVRPESKSRVIKVEQMRAMEKTLHMSGKGSRKMAVVVGAERLREGAANAFLKTLEEPPQGVMILLLTTQPEQLLTTILSRCIRVPLITRTVMAAPENRSEDEANLLEVLDQASGQKSSMALALRLKNQFSELLKNRKTTLGKESDKLYKSEVKSLQKKVDDSYFKGREIHYKTLAESLYIQQRTALLGVFASWFGDALRQLHTSPELDLPDYADSTGKLGAAIGTEGLMRKSEALETLRRHLDATNVNEALALDVAFLRMFG